MSENTLTKSLLEGIDTAIATGISHTGDVVSKGLDDALGGKPDAASREITSMLMDFADLFRSAGGKGDPLDNLDAAERAALASATKTSKEAQTTKTAEKSMASQVLEEPAEKVMPARSTVTFERSEEMDPWGEEVVVARTIPARQQDEERER